MRNYAEPWGSDEVVRDNESFIRLRSQTGGIVARLWLDVDYERFNDEQRAYARRIVACVNACRGLPMDELEQKGLVAAVGTQLLAADDRAEGQEREIRKLARTTADAENKLADALNQRDELLNERSRVGLAIDAAIRDGVVPDEHPLRSRLEMLANHRKREQELLDLLREASATLQACGALCDAVPTRLQNHEDDTLAGIGRIVNEQGLYHLVRDTEAKLRGAIDAEIAGTKAE